MKTINLTNYDKVDVFEENGNIFAFKKTKDGKQVINKLNVSRDMGNCSNVNAISLSNSAFYIVWMNQSERGNRIYGRRYTPQGLAGKINEFSVVNKPLLKDIKVELKDDFFIVLTWTSLDGNIYKKTFNQDADSKSEDLFIAKMEIDEVKKNFKESEENIKYKIVDPPIIEKTSAKVIDSPIIPKEIVFTKKSNMLMPLKNRKINLPSLTGKPVVLSERPVLPPIPTRELVFKTKKTGGRGTLRMKFN